MTDDEERELRIKVMQADLLLKTRQATWETPRNLAIVIGAVAAISAALAGWTGYQVARSPGATQIVLPPGTTITVPATKP